MKLFLHADRALSLHAGDVVENRVYPNGNSISLLGPLIDAEFSAHVDGLYRRGISQHGYNFLVGAATRVANFPDWAIEMYFEYMRYKHFPDCPSRLQSFFCFDTLDAAMAFAKSTTSAYSILEVAVEGRYFMADMSLLKLDFDGERQAENARKYWSGKPQDSAVDYRARWEYLVDSPVRIVRQVI